MSVIITTSTEGSVLLQGTLGFDTVVEALGGVTSALEALPAGQTSLKVDYSAITSSNSAGLALMAECKAMALAQGKSIESVGVPESIRKIAAICQLDELLFN